MMYTGLKEREIEGESLRMLMLSYQRKTVVAVCRKTYLFYFFLLKLLKTSYFFHVVYYCTGKQNFEYKKPLSHCSDTVSLVFFFIILECNQKKLTKLLLRSFISSQMFKLSYINLCIFLTLTQIPRIHFVYEKKSSSKKFTSTSR